MMHRTFVRSLSAAALTLTAVAADAQQDPRAGLKAGYLDAGSAAKHIELLANRPRPEGLFNPDNIGDLSAANTDFAFRGTTVFLGNFSGFSIWDASDPRNPTLISKLVCPGGQGDVSVHGDLLFMSVEAGNGRVDCGPQGVQGPVQPRALPRRAHLRHQRPRGAASRWRPCRPAAARTRTRWCRPRMTPPSSTCTCRAPAGVRPAAELEGCSGGDPADDPNTALFRIEIIEVPLAASAGRQGGEHAAHLRRPRQGNIAGLWMGGAHGEGTQRSSVTNQCHDITVYPEVGLAGGACSGNGILLDIRDPANPVRMDEVIDQNFAYWHSATFNNDGKKVCSPTSGAAARAALP
jgi:hypothetical protein